MRGATALRAAFGPQLAQEPVRHHGQINRPALQGGVHATGADDDTVAVLAHRAQHGVLRANGPVGAAQINDSAASLGNDPTAQNDQAAPVEKTQGTGPAAHVTEVKEEA